MESAIYSDLVAWYPLLDPVADHEDEAAAFAEALLRTNGGAAGSLLELGAGAGNNAAFVKQHFASTVLTDLSDPMLGLSRQQNPECEHIVGDMRSLRLDRTFDAVLLHDAVAYMTSEADLAAAFATAFAHLRPGGACLVAPDAVTETFAEYSMLHENDDPAAGRSMRCLEWTWQPDPTAPRCRSQFAFLLRSDAEVRAVHDQHEFGLFPRATWHAALSTAGFEVDTIRRPIEGEQGDEWFLCRRPA